jgi:ABC-type phosphate transport system substrate-binding protein
MHMTRRTLTLAVATTALVAAATGTALADPPAGTVPALTSIVGVSCPYLFTGSPTQNSAGSLVTDYNATNPASKIYCWDDVNPSTGATGDTIVTKGSSSRDTTCSMARPFGVDQQLADLEQGRTDGGDPCVDFAYSDRGPASTDPSTIAFAAMDGDAIAYASPEGSGTSPVPEGMTLADLVNIYSCTWTNWDQVPGNSGNNAPIVPVLPQNGSGTRTDFLLLLGGGVMPLAPGSCVVNASGTTAIEGDSGLSAANENAFDPGGVPAVDAVFPYSVADYIAQGPASNGVGGHASPIWGHGALVLHAMTDDTGTLQQPTTTNSGGQTVINQNFPAEMQHLDYNVVRNGGTAAAPAFPTTPAYEATALPAIFGPNGWICTNSTAQADMVSYGFYTLGSLCGSLTAG